VNDKTSKLNSIAESKAKLLEELQKLEEQEKTELANEAASAHANIISLLERYASFFSSKQRNEISNQLGESSGRAAPAAKSSRSEVKPKYQLPHTGETWTGRGRTPKSFAAWEGTAAYNEWKTRNPSLKFPLYRE
jgi:DNA-binding protein H-NS